MLLQSRPFALLGINLVAATQNIMDQFVIVDAKMIQDALKQLDVIDTKKVAALYMINFTQDFFSNQNDFGVIEQVLVGRNDVKSTFLEN